MGIFLRYWPGIQRSYHFSSVRECPPEASPSSAANRSVVSLPCVGSPPWNLPPLESNTQFRHFSLRHHIFIHRSVSNNTFPTWSIWFVRPTTNQLLNWVGYAEVSNGVGECPLPAFKIKLNLPEKQNTLNWYKVHIKHKIKSNVSYY